MDGISVLYPPADTGPLYKFGNAHGWLAKSSKTAASEYHLSGRLYLAKSGWLLLAVPNALVRGVFDALTAAGAELPLAGKMNVPNVDKDLLNAHISVMTADEVESIGANKINERGHAFQYSLGPVKELTPNNIDGISKVWAIQVLSPQLAALRKSYGLSPLPNGDHPFHITVAVRRKNVLRANDISKFDAATGRGELKAAADDKTTYECSCSGKCMCPDTCICKKSGCCGHDKEAAHEGAPWGTPVDKLPWRERVEVYARDPRGRIYGGIWNTDKSFAVPGGGIDPGEDPGQAALRELEEETGIKATNPQVLPIPPVDNAWSDKHRQEKQRNFAGSRTYFVAVDIVNKLRRKNLDKWDAAQRKMYDPAAAEQMMANHKNFMAPSVAAGRLAAIRHIIAQAAERSKAAAADPNTAILVSGHSGAGKSTLSKMLAEKLKLPLYQIDSHPDQKAFFAKNKDGQETVVGSPEYEEFQKLRRRTAEETLANVTGPAIVEGAQLAGLSPEQLSAYKTRIFVHTPLQQLLKQRLERQKTRQIAKGNEWTPELAAKKQQIGRAVYDVQNKLMQQYAKLPDTHKYTTRKDDIDALIARLTKRAADLLPGGEADKMPDSQFPPKALAEGKRHEHEHTTNDQIAGEIAKDHLQEDPAYYKKVRKIEGAEKAAMSAIVQKLREAKEHSDNKRYQQKNQILKMLMEKAPEEWVVDDPKPYHVGVTHVPTKFRLHADPTIIPPVVPVSKAAATNPYFAQLFNTAAPTSGRPGNSIWQNMMAHLRDTKARGDRQIWMEQNSQGLLAELNPAYKQQLRAQITSKNYPRPDFLTRLIQQHGDSVLGAAS